MCAGKICAAAQEEELCDTWGKGAVSGGSARRRKRAALRDCRRSAPELTKREAAGQRSGSLGFLCSHLGRGKL